jgi:glutathione synthase/RimK-type ligase-like ATP-grasp enzyme
MLIALVTWRGLPKLAPDDRLLRDALLRRGVDVRAVTWDDPQVDWRAFDSIVVRSTWDYHKRVDEFRAWLDAMSGLPLWNPPAVLRWNIHKSYLLDLQARGVNIVPTLFVPRGQDIIVKPAVSATAYHTARRASEMDCDVLVQPFVPEIVEDGELSFIFLGRKFSHAVRKRAGDGDFRVQTEFGGSVEPFAPSADLIAQAQRIAAMLGNEWLYARVDCVVRDGRLMLMELEATEPSLFLDADSAERFADAIVSPA